MNLDKTNTIYFIGIGGIGMSSLARYFLSKGHPVAGYDKIATPLTQELESEGAVISYKDNTTTIPDSVKRENTIVVYTPAIPDQNNILTYFRKSNLPLFKRSKILGMLTQSTFTIAVAGTHGKTTTSSIIAHLLEYSNKGCNAFLGGISTNFNSNLVVNPDSSNTVVEADEYDRSFLTLSPNIAIIISMDADHLDIYGNAEYLQESFTQFAEKIEAGGILIKKAGLSVNAKKHVTYGIDVEADYKAHNIRIKNGNYHFDIASLDGNLSNVSLGLPGKHNVENALAALIVGRLMNIDDDIIIAALRSFSGVKRRFEKIIDTNDLVYIDDYAHHPKELEMCISSVRKMYPEKKITGVFQPHLYSRTRDFADEFGISLALLDELILMDIYPAREEPIEGIDANMLLAKSNVSNKMLLSREELVENLKNRELEVLLTLGAGDIDAMVEPLKLALAS